MSWWLMSFGRDGPARYISHLDTVRVVQRTFARAGIEFALTQGMRPKPRLSLPLALPTGAAALDELAVVEVAEDTREAALGTTWRPCGPPRPTVSRSSGWSWRVSDRGRRRPRPPTSAACGRPAPTCAAPWSGSSRRPA